MITLESICFFFAIFFGKPEARPEAPANREKGLSEEVDSREGSCSVPVRVPKEALWFVGFESL